MYDLKKHLAAFSASNWNEWKSSLAGDVIYEEVATHVRVKGADAYHQSVLRWKRAFPDLKATVLETFMVGDKVFAEVEWEGTQAGPLEGPFGAIAPTNKRGVLKAAMFARLKDEKIIELHHYFDLMTLLANLGIMPFAGAPISPAKPGAAPVPRQ